MKQGRDIRELAAEIYRQNEAKRDFVAPTTSVEMVLAGARSGMIGEDTFIEGNNCLAPRAVPTQPTMALMGITDRFMVTPHTHSQIAAHLNIPKKFYDDLLAKDPDLLSVTVNTLFRRRPAERLVRTMDGNARAFLSNRFRPIDNKEVAEVILDIFAGSQAQIASCEITESKLYLKALFPKVQGEIARGDVVQMGVVVSNSEIGQGRFAVQPLIMRLVCTNGMILNDGSVKRAHLGMRHEVDGDGWATEFAKSDTLAAMDKALMLQVRDTVTALSTPAKIEHFIGKFRDAAEQRIEGDPVKVIETIQKKANLTEDDRGGILRHLIEGGDLSRWGVSNAITRYSQDVHSYDKATDLELLGGQIIELQQGEWRSIVKSAA